MHSFFKGLVGLQFFAEGAAAGDGGAGSTAEGAANAGQQSVSLERLGVPKAKAERHRARMAQRSVPEAEEAKAPEEAKETATETAKMTLEELLKDPDENAKMQSIVKDRLKKTNGELEKRRAYDEVLGIVAAKHGMKDFNIETGDAKALLAAMEGDKSYFEDEAFAAGKDPEQYMAERKQARMDRDQTKLQARAHFSSLQNQAEAMKAKYPGFDLEKELSNPRFFNMTSLAGGASVEEAYHALHFEEILTGKVNEAVQQATEALSKSVQAGRGMPVENGTDGRRTGTIPQKKYSEMTPEEQADFYYKMTGKRLSRR